MTTKQLTLKRQLPSSWVLKVTMAVTGTIWVLFVLIHLFGNLKVFTGAESFDNYAHWLRVAFYPFLPHGFVLWTMRLVLLACLVLHVVAGLVLWLRGRRFGTIQSRRAIWTKPRQNESRVQSVSARLMPVTGVAILAFLIIHILDLTTGTPPIASAQFTAATPETSSAYANLVASFQRPWMAAIYVAMMLLLSIHVLHGVQTSASDLGAVGRQWRRFFIWVAALCALAILLGNGAIPILVQTGYLK